MTSQWIARFIVASVITATVVLGMGPAVTALDTGSAGTFDVVFLIDGSPSMDGRASDTLETSVEFSRAVAEKRSDSRFAVIVYADHRWTRLQRDFTPDVNELEAGVASIAYGRNSTENASGAILRTFDSDLEPDMSFRSSATPLIVVITDEDDDGYCAVGEQALGMLDRHGAVLVSVSPGAPYDPGQPEPDCLTNATENDLDTIATEQVPRGYWVELSNPDYSPVIDDIPDPTPTSTATPTPTPTATVTTPTPTPTQAAKQTTSVNQHPDLEPARFEIVNRSVDPGVATLGETITVRVVVTNRGMLADQYVAVLSNENETLRSTRFSMGPGDIRSLEWNVTPVEPVNTTFFVNDEAVGTVEVFPPSATNDTGTTPSDNETTTSTRTGGTVTASTANGSGSNSPTASVESPPGDVVPEQTPGQPATSAGLRYPVLVGLFAIGVIALGFLHRVRR